MVKNIKKFFSTFLKEEQGAIAVMLAVAIIPTIFAVGTAIDLSRAYVARSRISHALDAAGLAVGSSQGTEAELRQIMENFFNKNYPSDAIGSPVSLNFEMNESVIRLSATRKVNTTFMKIAGVDEMNVYSETEITRETKGLEVALVLDNTGSMGSNGKIDALKTAASDLTNILFGNQESPDKLKVAMVPYVTSVNIGRDHKELIDFTNPLGGGFFTGNDSTDQSNTGTVWKGCVVSRGYPHNVSDTSTAEGGLWAPYAWPYEPGYRTGSTYYSSYCHNRAGSGSTAYTWRSIDETPSTTYGPNMSCPQPIRPLINSKSTILSDINQMTPWSYGGTMAHMGLTWGLRVLSPEHPFDEGLAWNTEGWNKAIIMLTDGRNELVRQSYRCYDYSSGPGELWPDGGPYTDFSGEGYPIQRYWDDLAGSSRSDKYNSMVNMLNTYTAEACQNIKDKGILLYTITFQLNDPTMQQLYRDCATDESKYFNSPSNEELQHVFKAIGAELSNLRISR